MVISMKFKDCQGFSRTFKGFYGDFNEIQGLSRTFKNNVSFYSGGADEICECKTAWCDEYSMCHSKTLIYPTFPQIGVLEYNGTTDGLVARDGDGRWYHEYSR